MRWWPPVLTALAGAALTLGAALWLDIQAAQGRIKPEPEVTEQTTVSLGADAPEFATADSVFPFERYVVDGEAQWLPLLLQLGDPELLESEKRACIGALAKMPEDARCRVEYSFWLDPEPGGRVLAVQAHVPSGDEPACRAYVECRLPGFMAARLDVPPGPFLEHPAGLRIIDRATHARHRPSDADEAQEIAELTELLAAPDHPDLVLMPPAAQRLQHYLRQTQARRLAVLQRRKQRR